MCPAAPSLSGGICKALRPSHTDAPLCALLPALPSSSLHLPCHDGPSNPGGLGFCSPVYPILTPHSICGLGGQQSWHDLQRSVKAPTPQKEKLRIVIGPTASGAVPCSPSAWEGSEPRCPLLALRCEGSWEHSAATVQPAICGHRLGAFHGSINHPATGCCFSKLPPVCLYLG